jgi:hypothetical protein
MRVAIAAVLAAAILAGCGEDSEDAEVVLVPPDPYADEAGEGVDRVEGQFTVDQVLDAYQERIGLPLRIDDRVKGRYVTLTTLPGPPYAPIAPDLGLFSVYVAADEREADALVGRAGLAEEEVASEPGVRFVAGPALLSARARFGNVVLDWNVEDEGEARTDERFQRLADPLESLGEEPPPERAAMEPCATAEGPDADSAPDGTCRLGPQVVTFANRGETLDFGGVRVRLIGAAAEESFEAETYEVLPHQREDLSVGPEPAAPPEEIRAKGVFYVVRLEIENEGDEPLEDLEAGLVVRDRLFNRDLDNAFYVDETNPPFPLEPGDSGELLLLFDLPPRFVPDGSAPASLVLVDPRNEHSLAIPGSAATISRLRLSD